MLLRSASSPILNSWVPLGKEPSPDHAAADVVLHPQIPKVPHHLSSSISLSSAPAASSSRKRMMMTRALSEGDLLSIPSAAPNGKEEVEEEDPDSGSSSLTRLLSNSGLDGLGVDGIHGYCAVDQKGGSSARASTLVAGGGCAGGGGKICGGGGRGGCNGDDGFGFSSDSYRGTDAYYLKMIESNPGNSLVLGNYARFLKEVRGDVVKAEEYCERAILACPGDGDVLSLYADLVWQTRKDAQRAERYFDQAVQAAPQDCYVMASYARFLWDAEDEEEEEEGKKGGEEESKFSPPPLFQGSTAPSVAAAS